MMRVQHSAQDSIEGRIHAQTFQIAQTIPDSDSGNCNNRFFSVYVRLVPTDSHVQYREQGNYQQ